MEKVEVISILTVVFHGHSCFSVISEKYHLLIDPFISGNPLSEIKAEDINPSHILVTHGHGDHLGDAIAISRRTNALLIAPNELGVYCQQKGANVHRMHIGGSREFEFGWLKLAPAWHGSAVFEGDEIIYTGTPCGFIIKINERYIYHAGDTGIFGDMELIGNMYPLDYALLPIGDNYVMGPEDASLAAEMLQAKIVIPMHYNTFPEILQDPNRFVELVKSCNPDQEVRVLSPGESISL